MTWQERTLAVFPKSLRIPEWLDYLHALFQELHAVVFAEGSFDLIPVCRETRKTLRQQLKALEYALSAAIELRASALGWDAHEVPSPAPPPPPPAPRAPSVEGTPARALRFRRRPDPSLPRASTPRPRQPTPDANRVRAPFVITAVRRTLRCWHAIDHFEEYARRLARKTTRNPLPVRRAQPLPPTFATPPERRLLGGGGGALPRSPPAARPRDGPGGPVSS